MSHLPAWGLKLLSSGYYGERREGVGPGVMPTAHPESPASESRRFSRVSKLLPGADGAWEVSVDLYLSSLPPPESYATHM